jgi:hypothetical protein
VGCASVGAGDQVALQIEKRLEEVVAAELWGRSWRCSTRPRRRGSTLADMVAAYEAEASRLGAIPFDDARRPAAHLAHQASGDALPEQLAAATAVIVEVDRDRRVLRDAQGMWEPAADRAALRE